VCDPQNIVEQIEEVFKLYARALLHVTERTSLLEASDEWIAQVPINFSQTLYL
jgi:hypothetical protein